MRSPTPSSIIRGVCVRTRRCGPPRSWRRRACPMWSASIAALRPGPTASATLRPGARTRNCPSCAPVWRPSIRQPISSSVRLTATSPRSARSAALSWNRKMRRKFRRISRGWTRRNSLPPPSTITWRSWKPPGCCNTPIRWTPGSRRLWRSWRSCGRAILPTSVIRWTV